MKRIITVLQVVTVAVIVAASAIAADRAIARTPSPKPNRDCYPELFDAISGAIAIADEVLNSECDIPDNGDPELTAEQLQTVREAMQTWIQQQPGEQ